MSKERFEFKILNDKDGSETNLDNLSLRESKAFLVLLESMISIAENTGISDDFEIKIEKGSACVAIESSDLSPLVMEYSNILKNESNNAEAVQAFRNVQNLFWNNGLTYSSKIKTMSNVSSNIFNEISKARTFRTKSIKRSREYQITFLEGNLQEIGGKNPNFHIVKNGKTIKIECLEQEAQRIKDELYKTIRLSVIETKLANNRSLYKFIDFYRDVNDYKFYQNLIERTYEFDHLDFLREINKLVKDTLRSEDYTKTRQILKLFNNHFTDDSILKTILIITKHFSERSEIKHIRKSIKSILEKNRGEVLI